MAERDSLHAGVARREITPPVSANLLLWGYWGRNEPAAGALDPLLARVLVLRGVGSVALVTLDLGTTPHERWLDRWRSVLQSEEHLDTVIFSASHTHAGPSVQPSALESAPASAWIDHVFAEIRAAVKEASAHAQPVRIGFGAGESWIGNNRRLVLPDGQVEMIFRDSPKVRNLPVDTAVRVARIDRLDGTPLAVVVHYACHPVTLGGGNVKYSADWPGAMIAEIEEQVPGRPMAMFVQGALGDINLMEPLAGKSGEAERVEIGRAIGREAARVASAIATTARPATRIQTCARNFSFANRWDYDALMKLPDDTARRPIGVFRENYSRTITARVNIVSIGDFWSWVTIPGEPFVAFQMQIANAWLCGCVDGYLGYFPTARAASEGGYGARGCETWVEVGAGERIVANAVATLYRMNNHEAAVPPESK